MKGNKPAGIRVTVVIGLQNPGFESLRRICHHLRCHRIRQVHREERDVNCLQILHLRDIFRISRHVDTFVTECYYIAVALSLLFIPPFPFARVCTYQY